MTNKLFAIVVGALLVVLLLLFSTTYSVRYNEVAIRSTFGRAGEGSIVREAGWHFRLPIFIDRVTKLDTRLQIAETPLEEIMLRDHLQVVVRAYLLWRVDEESARGPLDFFDAYESISGAGTLLADPLRTAVTGTLSGYAFDELVGPGNRLAEAEGAIKDELVRRLASTGVRAEQVGVSQLIFPANTSRAVIERMDKTRQALAGEQQSAGIAIADSIRSRSATMGEKIRKFAEQRAEEIRAEAQKEVARYLSEMAPDEDLAIFLLSLDVLEQALAERTTFVVSTEQAPFHLMSPATAVRRNSIPQPPGSEPASSSADERAAGSEATFVPAEARVKAEAVRDLARKQAASLREAGENELAEGMESLAAEDDLGVLVHALALLEQIVAAHPAETIEP